MLQRAILTIFQITLRQLDLIRLISYTKLNLSGVMSYAKQMNTHSINGFVSNNVCIELGLAMSWGRMKFLYVKYIVRGGSLLILFICESFKRVQYLCKVHKFINPLVLKMYIVCCFRDIWCGCLAPIHNLDSIRKNLIAQN